MVTGVIATSESVADTEATVGSEYSTKEHDVFSIYVDYTKGNEAGLILKVFGMRESGGDQFQLGQYTNSSGVLTPQPQQIELTSSGKKPPVSFDVKGVNYVVVKQVRKGAVAATGTFNLSYVRTKK